MNLFGVLVWLTFAILILKQISMNARIEAHQKHIEFIYKLFQKNIDHLLSLSENDTEFVALLKGLKKQTEKQK